MLQMTECQMKMITHGTFLGTRFLGQSVREEVLSACHSFDRVVIDFEGVTEVSHSFADECFGELIEVLGPEQFRKQIRFKNAAGETASLLKLVMARHTHPVPA